MRRLILLVALAAGCTAALAENLTAPTVGMTGKLAQLVLPGSELEPIPLDDDTRPIILRITGVFAHGSDNRYDFEFYGLDPGKYDLRDYLRRKDGTSMDGVPEIPVEILAVREPRQIKPNSLEPDRLPWVGGYFWALVGGGVLWFAVLLMLIFVGRGKKAKAEALAEREPTLAERLRPIVAKAAEGDLSKDEQARLERLLLAVWREKLELKDVPAAEALPQLRNHEEAGVLLRTLEEWLHRPGGASEDVDIDSLLEPYRNLPATS